MIPVLRITREQYEEAAQRVVDWAKHDSTTGLLARDFLEALTVREAPVNLGELFGRADQRNRIALIHIIDGFGTWGPCPTLDAWRVRWFHRQEAKEAGAV